MMTTDSTATVRDATHAALIARAAELGAALAIAEGPAVETTNYLAAETTARYLGQDVFMVDAAGRIGGCAPSTNSSGRPVVRPSAAPDLTVRKVWAAKLTIGDDAWSAAVESFAQEVADAIGFCEVVFDDDAYVHHAHRAA